jgi:phosphocarrier protein HPr
VKNERTMIVLIDNVDKVKRLANIAMSLPFYVDAVSERWKVDAKSLLGLLSLDVSKPIELRFDAENEDRVRFAFSGFEVGDE